MYFACFQNLPHLEDLYTPKAPTERASCFSDPALIHVSWDLLKKPQQIFQNNKFLKQTNPFKQQEVLRRKRSVLLSRLKKTRIMSPVWITVETGFAGPAPPGHNRVRPWPWKSTHFAWAFLDGTSWGSTGSIQAKRKTCEVSTNKNIQKPSTTYRTYSNCPKNSSETREIEGWHSLSKQICDPIHQPTTVV